MSKIKTWSEIRSYDEIIDMTPGLKHLIYEIEANSERKCPYLRKEGNCFYYCGVDVPEDVKRELSPFSPIFLKHTDHLSLQLYCMADYEKCMCHPSSEDKTKLEHFFE